MASLEVRPLAKSFQSVFMGAAGVVLPSDDEFNRVSFLSHFDGTNNGVNNVFDDSSSSNHTITANGNVTQGSFGPFARPDGEWSVSFDGSGDRVRANWAENVGTSDFTVEAWVFIPSDMDQYDCIAWLQEANHSSAGDNGFFIRANGSNTIEFAVLSGSTVYNTVSSAISFGEWHHLSLSKSGTTMYSSVDGTVTTRSAPSGINNSKYLNIGAADANGSVSYPFKGIISNVRFLIGTALYTSSFTVPTSPLTAITNTKFLGCQSNRFVDNSANDYTVSTSGDATVSAFGPFLTSSVYDAGVNGASAYFGGSGDYISSSSSSDFAFGTGDFTVDFWFYLTASSWRLLLDQVYNSLGIAIWINPNRELGFWPGATEFATTAPVNYNVWNHVALVRSSGVTRIYANGVSGATYSDSNNYTSTVGFKVASDYVPETYGYEGYISNVRAVKGTAVYTSNFTPPTAPTTAITNTKLLLNMSDGQAIDSAAQNNLTLFGDAKISSTQSKFGGTSMVFDGTGDYAYIPDGFPAFGTGDLTIEFWINPSNVTNNKVSLYDARDNQSDSPIVWQNNAGIYLFAASDRIIISSGLSVGTWAHVALVRSSGVYKLYLDGTASGTTYANTDALVAKDLYIAGRYTADTAFYNGYIDDFRISSMARYVSNFTPPTEPFADKGQ
jgi:hypothetical protein